MSICGTRWSWRGRSARRLSARSISTPVQPDSLERWLRPSLPSSPRRNRGRRRLHHRLHLRHDRRAQRHDAFSPRRDGDLRLLPALLPAAAPGRHLLRHAAARVHLRAGRAAAVSHALRRLHGADRKAHAHQRCSQPSSSIARRSASPRRLSIAQMAAVAFDYDITSLKKCVSAGEALPDAHAAAVGEGDRHRSSSTASARPRCCTSSSPRPETTFGRGATGNAIPGYRRGCSTTKASRCRRAWSGGSR